MIKNKFKELLSQIKKFKVQTILVLKYKKRNGLKIFHSNVKVFASDSDIIETFKSIFQNLMTKTINSAREDWIVIETIEKHGIKFFECQYKHRKWR